MALYDSIGTTATPLGKFFDFDGTAKRPLGKLFDINGTTASPIFSAECSLFPTSETGSTYTSWGGGGVSVTADGYLQISLSTSEVKNNYCEIPVDLSGYNYINFTLSEVSSSDGFWCNVGVSATAAFAPQNYKAVTKGTSGTYSADISSLNGEYYIALRGLRGKYDGKAFFITKIWLS